MESYSKLKENNNNAPLAGQNIKLVVVKYIKIFLFRLCFYVGIKFVEQNERDHFLVPTIFYKMECNERLIHFYSVEPAPLSKI